MDKLSKQFSMSQSLFETRDSLQAEFDCLQLDLTAPSGDLSSESIHDLNTAILPKSSSENDNLNIVVACESPYRFRAISPEFLQLFRFQNQELVASSLRMLFGPETDVAGLRALIEGRCSTAQIPLVLYRKDGDEVRCTVRVPTKGARNEHGECALAFEVDAGGCSSLTTTPPVLHATYPSCSPALPHADYSAAADGQICTLLSHQAVFGSDVEIHIRAVRSAAAAAATAARHERHAGQARLE